MRELSSTFPRSSTMATSTIRSPRLGRRPVVSVSRNRVMLPDQPKGLPIYVKQSSMLARWVLSWHFASIFDGDDRADSIGRRDILSMNVYEQLVEGFGGRLPAKRFSWPRIGGVGDGIKCVGGVPAQVGAFWEVLSQQAIGVFVRAALPRGFPDRRSRPAARYRGVAWRAEPSRRPDPK